MSTMLACLSNMPKV